MAKNIEMQYYSGSTYEVCYPKTLASNVILGSTALSSLGLSSGATVDDGFVKLRANSITQNDMVNYLTTNAYVKEEEINEIIANSNTNIILFSFDVAD